METWKNNNIKTTVSVPTGVLETFKKYHSLLPHALHLLLPSALAAQPRRDRATEYNHIETKFEIVQVYWPLEVYNKLHAVAASQRVSVSYLVYRLFLFLLDGITIKPTQNFSNYVIYFREWSPEAIFFEEGIHYSSKKYEIPPEPPAA
ncbi:MAG: hypothetical protein ACOY5B_18265 [Spirochaetota bacterium]